MYAFTHLHHFISTPVQLLHRIQTVVNSIYSQAMKLEDVFPHEPKLNAQLYSMQLQYIKQVECYLVENILVEIDTVYTRFVRFINEQYAHFFMFFFFQYNKTILECNSSRGNLEKHPTQQRFKKK